MSCPDRKLMGSPVTSASDHTSRQMLTRLTRSFTHRYAALMAVKGAAVAVFIAALWESRHLFRIPQPAHGTPSGALFVRALLVVLALGVCGAIVGLLLAGARFFLRGRTAAIATALERLVPSSRNLLFTALEMATDERDCQVTSRALCNAPYAQAARSIVLNRAGQLATTIDIAILLPSTAALRILLGAMGLWFAMSLAASWFPSGALTHAATRAVARMDGTMIISSVDVDVSPPVYASRPSLRLHNPMRIDALEGSTLTFVISAVGGAVVVTSDSGDTLLSPAAGGEYLWHTTVGQDGMVALSMQSLGSNAVSAQTTDRTAQPRLFSIVVQPDAPPGVVITRPGRDIMVDSTRMSLPIVVNATDDIGLRSLSLLYTRVSGSNEQFTFHEGRVPLRISRQSANSWHADATLRLDSLLREPGDLVVYRALATDSRPTSRLAESDAFIVEWPASGGIGAAGFSLDPDEERYAVSQQMVIFKTERLIASSSSLPSEVVASQAREIAMEQHRVRAEFVFMTGGEFEQAIVADEEGLAELDETEEAEAEAELSAGRMVNRGRAALLAAIRAMSKASLALTQSELATALHHEKVALDSLQEAFSRQRFLMRALSQRERLDLTRRLSGSLDSVANTTVPVAQGDPETVRIELRHVLDALVSKAHVPSATRGPGSRQPSFTTLAVRVLRLEPRSTRGQRIAAWLQAVDRANTIRQPSRETRAALDSATSALSEWLISLTAIDAGTARRPEP